MKFLSRSTARKFLDNVLGLGESDAAPKADSLESERDDQIEKLQREIAILKKNNLAYFELIERIEKQRDERWDMFLLHSSEHQNAQALLENALFQTRAMLKNAIEQLNVYLKNSGKKLIDRPNDLMGYPIGTAKEFGEKMEDLRKKMSPSIDGKRERSAITEGNPVPVVQKDPVDAAFSDARDAHHGHDPKDPR